MQSIKVILFLGLTVCLLCGCYAHSPSSLANAVRPQELAGKDWIELGQPGVEHRELDRFVGEWNVSISSRATPTQAPEVSQGRSNLVWVLDNRFIEEHFSGSIAGHSYMGRGFFGYENATRRYVNVWIESLATGVTLMYGSFDPAQQRFDFEGNVYEPLLGRLKAIKTRVSFISKDEFTMSMVEKTLAGDEFTSFELRYQRVGLG
jgi:hypothetical protein